MALAAVASQKKAQAGGSKKEMVRAHGRLRSSAPVNPMRPHTIEAGRRRQARRVVAEGQAKARAMAAAMGHEVPATTEGRPALS